LVAATTTFPTVVPEKAAKTTVTDQSSYQCLRRITEPNQSINGSLNASINGQSNQLIHQQMNP